jgi:hypothetical protein
MPLGIRIMDIDTWTKMLHVILEFHTYWLWAYQCHSYHTRTSVLYPTLGPINKTQPGRLATIPASRCHDYSSKPRFRASLPIRSSFQPPARLRTAYISHSFSSLISRELIKYCRLKRLHILNRVFWSRLAWSCVRTALVNKLRYSGLRYSVVM